LHETGVSPSGVWGLTKDKHFNIETTIHSFFNFRKLMKDPLLKHSNVM